jgi:hypothetical protein
MRNPLKQQISRHKSGQACLLPPQKTDSYIIFSNVKIHREELIWEIAHVRSFSLYEYFSHQNIEIGLQMDDTKQI